MPALNLPHPMHQSVPFNPTSPLDIAKLYKTIETFSDSYLELINDLYDDKQYPNIKSYQKAATPILEHLIQSSAVFPNSVRALVFQQCVSKTEKNPHFEMMQRRVKTSELLQQLLEKEDVSYKYEMREDINSPLNGASFYLIQKFQQRTKIPLALCVGLYTAFLPNAQKDRAPNVDVLDHALLHVLPLLDQPPSDVKNQLRKDALDMAKTMLKAWSIECTHDAINGVLDAPLAQAVDTLRNDLYNARSPNPTSYQLIGSNA